MQAQKKSKTTSRKYIIYDTCNTTSQHTHHIMPTHTHHIMHTHTTPHHAQTYHITHTHIPHYTHITGIVNHLDAQDFDTEQSLKFWILFF